MRTPSLFWLLKFFALGLAAEFSITPARAQSPAARYYAEGLAAYQAGDLLLARKQFQLAVDTDPAFQPARASLARVLAEQRQAGAGAALNAAQQSKQLDRLIIPVEFENTTLSAALEYLRQKAADQTGGKVQPNFVLKLSPELAAKRISLKLANVPLPETLRYIGDLAGVRFQMDRFAILVLPAGAAPPGSSPVATP